MLFLVPGATSSLGFPGTVTRPGLVGCLNWRWLPLVATKYHPSSLSIAKISEIFIGYSSLPITNFLVCTDPVFNGLTTKHLSVVRTARTLDYPPALTRTTDKCLLD